MTYIPGGSGGSIATSSDVALNNPTDEQVLTYDAGIAKWTNASDSRIITLSQAEYDNLSYRDPDALYVISSAASTSPVSSYPGTGTLSEPFDTLDPAKWTIYPGASVSGGVLLLEASSSYSSIRTVQSYDMSAFSAHIEVMQLPNVSNGSTQAYFDFRIDSSNLVAFLWENNQLFCRLVMYGEVSNVTLPYDAVSMRVWRLRGAGGILYWETSGDGSTWTERRYTNVPSHWAGMGGKVTLQSGNWNSATVPGQAKFDNLNLTPSATSVGTVPSAPAATVSGTTASSVSINWSVPAEPNGTISGYRFGAGSETDVNFQPDWSQVYASPANPFTFTGMQASTTYTVWVEAINENGTGVRTTLTAKTQAGTVVGNLFSEDFSGSNLSPYIAWSLNKTHPKWYHTHISSTKVDRMNGYGVKADTVDFARMWTQQNMGGPGAAIRLKTRLRTDKIRVFNSNIEEGSKIWVKWAHDSLENTAANCAAWESDVLPGSYTFAAQTNGSRYLIAKRRPGSTTSTSYTFAYGSSMSYPVGTWETLIMTVEWFSSSIRIRGYVESKGTSPVVEMIDTSTTRPEKPVFPGIRTDGAAWSMDWFTVDSI